MTHGDSSSAFNRSLQALQHLKDRPNERPFSGRDLPLSRNHHINNQSKPNKTPANTLRFCLLTKKILWLSELPLN